MTPAQEVVVVRLTLADLSVLDRALQEMPYRLAAPLIAKINAQIQAQQQQQGQQDESG